LQAGLGGLGNIMGGLGALIPFNFDDNNGKEKKKKTT
jgi:hypothetical protein